MKWGHPLKVPLSSRRNNTQRRKSFSELSAKRISQSRLWRDGNVGNPKGYPTEVDSCGKRVSVFHSYPPKVISITLFFSFGHRIFTTPEPEVFAVFGCRPLCRTSHPSGSRMPHPRSRDTASLSPFGEPDNRQCHMMSKRNVQISWLSATLFWLITWAAKAPAGEYARMRRMPIKSFGCTNLCRLVHRRIQISFFSDLILL